MKGVGFGGKDDKILAVSPHHMSKCAKCGKDFREGEGPRFTKNSMLPYHDQCLPRPGVEDTKSGDDDE
jgi:hypothetical protein